MSPWNWFGLRGPRGKLKRVSPERARLVPLREKRSPLPRFAEVLCLTVVTGILAVLVLGVGRGLGTPGFLGLGLLCTLGLTGFGRHLYANEQQALLSLPRLVMLACCLLVDLAAMRMVEVSFGPAALAFIPLGLTGLVLALAWSRAFAVQCSLLLLSAGALMLFLRPGGLDADGLRGLAIATSGAACAALLGDRIRRRSAFLRIGLQIGFVQALCAAAFWMIGSGSPVTSWPGDLSILFLSGIAVGLLVSGFLPFVEALFRFTTDVSLLELGNTQEHPLLKKLLLDAPGTFHHSYIVGLISEAAAESVDANPLLARVGSLFHDVGKLNKPDYFAENSKGARERHRNLTPEMSNLIISSHTRDGLELGGYFGLPQVVLDFMTEHHGTTCMEYFYQRAVGLRGAENVSEESFRYPGPKPRSIETAIVMIADAVEAISRQMPEPTTTRLREMVHEVVMKRLLDGQFEDCPMQLRDLRAIEDACTQVLSGIYHTRPTFPKGRANPLDLSQPRERRQPTGTDVGAETGERARRGEARGASGRP